MNIDELPAAALLEQFAQTQQEAGSSFHLGAVLILPHRHLHQRLQDQGRTSELHSRRKIQQFFPAVDERLAEQFVGGPRCGTTAPAPGRGWCRPNPPTRNWRAPAQSRASSISDLAAVVPGPGESAQTVGGAEVGGPRPATERAVHTGLDVPGLRAERSGAGGSAQLKRRGQTEGRVPCVAPQQPVLGQQRQVAGAGVAGSPNRPWRSLGAAPVASGSASGWTSLRRPGRCSTSACPSCGPCR